MAGLSELETCESEGGEARRKLSFLWPSSGAIPSTIFCLLEVRHFKLTELVRPTPIQEEGK